MGGGGGKGALLEILNGGDPSRSPNPKSVSDQKRHFFTPVFRLGVYNPFQFSEPVSTEEIMRVIIIT